MVTQTIMTGGTRKILAAMVLFGAYFVSPSLSQSIDIDALNQRVTDLYRKGDFEDALPIALQVLSARESALEPNNPGVAIAIINLAKIYNGLKRYSEAEPLFKRALALQEQYLGPTNPNYLITLGNFGNFYFAQARYSQAEPLYQRALAIREQVFGPDSPEAAFGMNTLANDYYRENRFAEAEPLLLHAKSILEKSVVPDDASLSYTLTGLGDLYFAEGRYAQAQPLYERALTIRSKILDPNSLLLAYTMNALADLYYAQNRRDDAAALYVRTLAIRESVEGSDGLDVAYTLNCLANLYEAETKYDDAEPLYKRAIAIREKVLGHNNGDVAFTLKNLGQSYAAQGRYADAEALLKEAQTIQEQVLGPDSRDLANTLNSLANLYGLEGRYNDADPLLRRALSIQEKLLGPDHPDIAVTLNLLGDDYQWLGRYADAETVYQRALHIQELALGPNSPDLAHALDGLGSLYETEGHYADAEAPFKRAIDVQQNALGTDNPLLQLSVMDLALLYLTEKNFADAEPLFQRALPVEQKALGSDHIVVAALLDGLAKVYASENRYQDAEPLFKQALAIQEKLLGPDHYLLAYPLSNLGLIYTAQGRYAEAEVSLRRSLAIDERNLAPTSKGMSEMLGFLCDLFRSERRYSDALPIVQRMIANDNATTSTALPVLYGAMSNGLLTREEAVDESLIVLQQSWHTSAGDAINALAARLSVGDGRLAQLVRRNQDLTAETNQLQGALVAAVSADPSRRNVATEQNARDRIAAVGEERKDIESDLIKEFPDFAALSKPQPLAVKDVQPLLADDEAVVVINLGEKSYIWTITNDFADWKELPVSDTQISSQVTTLRSLLSVANPKPFDPKLSFDLYETIIGPVEGLIRSKPRLSFIVNGALASLPPQVFVTSNPAGKTLGEVQWLIRSHAVTLLPSLASLKVLRIKAGTAAQKPLIGFADPVFDTDVSSSKITAKIAGDEPGTQPARDPSNAFAELPRLRSTADELRKVAVSLKASADDIFVGRDATETQVKRAKLDQYRVIYFATHALLANQTADVANIDEPALVLTQPQKPSDFDDGLLTESEVALLKLDAEWVVLSACDTAAGDKPDAESLSGLARAFFYAGARSLLVSNWDVETDSAVQLMEGTFAALAADSNLSHGEALRRSMLAMIDHERKKGWDDPKFWAPFVVVGEPERASVKRRSR